MLGIGDQHIQRHMRQRIRKQLIQQQISLWLLWFEWESCLWKKEQKKEIVSTSPLLVISFLNLPGVPTILKMRKNFPNWPTYSFDKKQHVSAILSRRLRIFQKGFSSQVTEYYNCFMFHRTQYFLTFARLSSIVLRKILNTSFIPKEFYIRTLTVNRFTFFSY